MRKIPTVYRRDPNDLAHVTDEVDSRCAWVLAGEGVPRRMFNGTCVMLDEDGTWWSRREVRAGKTAPPGFVAVERSRRTGRTVGWEPIGLAPIHRFHAQAVASHEGLLLPGTYELCGPKIGNKKTPTIENAAPGHFLVRHADADPATGFDADDPKDLVRRVGLYGWEGIVWHHPDGRLAKLKVRDLR